MESGRRMGELDCLGQSYSSSADVLMRKNSGAVLAKLRRMLEVGYGLTGNLYGRNETKWPVPVARSSARIWQRRIAILIFQLGYSR